MAALAAGDAARFQAVPGIGKRTAERIIVELREKVVDADGAASGEPEILARRGERSRAARRWPAKACSSSATRPPRPTSCCATAEGETPEELIAAALRLARSAG